MAFVSLPGLTFDTRQVRRSVDPPYRSQLERTHKRRRWRKGLEIVMQKKEDESEVNTETPRDKLVNTVRSFLLGQYTSSGDVNKFEVEREDEGLYSERLLKKEGVDYDVRSSSTTARAPRNVAVAISSQEDLEEDEWEQRYRGIFIEERPGPFNTNPDQLKDEAEKISLGVIAVFLLIFLLKAMFAFLQFMFSFTFSFFAIFLLSAGIFVLFALTRF